MDSFITIVTTLTDQLQKPTLAFLLGGMMLAALGSRFEIPQPVYKFIVILLLLKVGLSGGLAMRDADLVSLAAPALSMRHTLNSKLCAGSPGWPSR